MLAHLVLVAYNDGYRGDCKAGHLMVGSDGAARVRCGGSSCVCDGGGVQPVQLLLPAFVLR